ncbi:MAG: glycoside hydrolase family 43 protein [Anaerolineae bacterium]|nr:glycoside hydrolase family 43 protein [Anaerolineae bacterium]
MTPSYQNPLYPGYFADPFVFRHAGHYYAFGTGPDPADGRVFPTLSSPDLVHWTAHGGALEPVLGADQYWAPEVAWHDGLFYLYYSAHGINGCDHQLRVATSAHPLGPYSDCGLLLVPGEPFTIDAHPFRAADGTWYLYYSRDFLTLDGADRVGTGIVVDRLVTMSALAGQPQVVVRPHADWQLYEAGRLMYGARYDWHTIEGAAVREHNGRYYCFYSGGAWERENYGVSYVVADHPLGPYTRPDGLDGALLRSLPGQVIGPGHNSFVTAPDGQEMIVYHGWDVDRTARQMRMDRLTWHDGRPILRGPTVAPQPALWLNGVQTSYVESG